MSETWPFSKAYQLRLAILKRLMPVIDPETSVDVELTTLIKEALAARWSQTNEQPG